MAQNDYAVIVGLQNYPGLDSGQTPLSGPVNDALAFRNWIGSPTGADVPDNNIFCILSSSYPSTTQLFAAKPAFGDIYQAFQTLRSISTTNFNQGMGPRVGRRLYLFMSGHGIAPLPYGNKTEKEAGLLMADVDPTNIGAPTYHIPGTYVANWYCQNDCFEEVFLFMDCCRDIEIVPTLHIFLPTTGIANTATRFYAFATEWSRLARERPDPEGKMMGIFTRTLMMGLEGGAAVPVNGNLNTGTITAASLKGYLFNNMKSLIDPSFLPNPKFDTPDIDYFPKVNNGENIIISQNVQLQKFPVTIHIPAGTSDAVTIMYNGLMQVSQLQITNPPVNLFVDLPRGKYTAIIAVNNSPVVKTFDVTGMENTANRGLVVL